MHSVEDTHCTTSVGRNVEIQERLHEWSPAPFPFDWLPVLSRKQFRSWLWILTAWLLGMCKEVVWYFDSCGILRIPGSSTAADVDGPVQLDNALARHIRCKMPLPLSSHGYVHGTHLVSVALPCGYGFVHCGNSAVSTGAVRDCRLVSEIWGVMNICMRLNGACKPLYIGGDVHTQCDVHFPGSWTTAPFGMACPQDTNSRHRSPSLVYSTTRRSCVYVMENLCLDRSCLCIMQNLHLDRLSLSVHWILWFQASPRSVGIMADGRGGGQGAYHRPLNVYAAALAIWNYRPAVPPQPKFDLAGALLGPVPTKSNTTFELLPSLSMSWGAR